jgi:two-component system nitrogen regulation response regulator GlnG
LNVVPLRLPPLRERTEDLPDLVRHFLARAETEGLPRKELTPEAVDRLMQHRWPGNVRELENIIKRLMAIESDDTITAASVERELAAVPMADATAPQAGFNGLPEFMENHLSQLFAGFGASLPPAGMHDRVLAEVEPPLLRACLVATNGNQLRAAELLGINRNTLRSKLRQYNIKAIRGLA